MKKISNLFTLFAILLLPTTSTFAHVSHVSAVQYSLEHIGVGLVIALVVVVVIGNELRQRR